MNNPTIESDVAFKPPEPALKKTIRHIELAGMILWSK